ncbi:uncharacterized protein LOC134262520 [Saccostrea cucullata]|uniref:uncharacterized protein LOC134262520 n=1 Tax=Saccostrea cuccullata TaxID=36930 RepID=UPI002ED4D017
MLKMYFDRSRENESNEGIVGAAVLDVDDDRESDDEVLCDSPVETKKEGPVDVKVSDELTDNEKADVKTLLENVSDVLSDVPGLTNLGVHHIKLTNEKPTRTKPYLLPFTSKDIVCDGGYWQLPLDDASKEITDFQTPSGLFQFRVMPFGLINASASFSRLMRKLLDGLQCVDNFIDDLIVYTRTFQEHIKTDASDRGVGVVLMQEEDGVKNLSHTLAKNFPNISKFAIQNISELVFVRLCHKLGTSQLVAMRRDVVDVRDMLINHVKTSDNRAVMFSGSHREGFRLKGSDADLMYWPNNHRVIWDLSQSQNYNTLRQTLILCDCSDSPPGFTLLFLLSPSMKIEIQFACVRMNNRHYISSFIYRQIMCYASSNTSTQHGPCVSGTIGTLYFDSAYCLVCDFWPPSASSWIDRCHSWPMPHVVDDIVKNGCHFVAIGRSHVDHEWRISFSLAEQKLVYAMNHCQFLTYGLLKIVLKEIINNGLSDNVKLLCSYHMKTSAFWSIQQNIIPNWCPQNLLECFWVCFKLILKWVYEGTCPNFFIPDNNMFLSKIYGEKQHRLFIKLYGLYEKGLVFLLHSPSIRSCIINVLHNPRLSICTDDHTLISETEFDRDLYGEIETYDVVCKLNIQRCMGYLRTIEEVINSFLLTSYQVPMLQKLTARILQSTAFILHFETYTNKNKLRYRADKRSCHMLKLASKFAYITDMVYIVMYFYKTLRYKEALSVVETIKINLAQPYVMYRNNVDTEMYTEAVGGQSWSTKMRQAVAWDIILDHDIPYISELIPEQQSALQNRRSLIFVPPFLLIYMLEILCCRHVDIMRVQTAIDDLQTLVHYDQGQFIHSMLKDISWQILGICQQVTGNHQAALYSYQQSLRQESTHNIYTATEMRMQGIC